MDSEQTWMPKQHCKMKKNPVGRLMYYYNHVLITPSSRKEIISSLCAFLIKKGKGKMMKQIEQIFPVTGRTHCAAVPLYAAWKKKANL